MVTPLLKAFIAESKSAEECPSETKIFNSLRREMTSKEPFNSGANVINAISDSNPFILSFKAEILGLQIFSMS